MTYLIIYIIGYIVTAGFLFSNFATNSKHKVEHPLSIAFLWFLIVPACLAIIFFNWLYKVTKTK